MARAMSDGDVTALLTPGLTVTTWVHLLPRSDPDATIAKLKLDWGASVASSCAG